MNTVTVSAHIRVSGVFTEDELNELSEAFEMAGFEQALRAELDGSDLEDKIEIEITYGG